MAPVDGHAPRIMYRGGIIVRPENVKISIDSESIQVIRLDAISSLSLSVSL